MVGVVTSFEYDGREYDVPVGRETRKQFASRLAQMLSELDGVDSAAAGDSTRSWDEVTFEITVESSSATPEGVRLEANPRSVSPRIKNTIEDFIPAAGYEYISKPNPIDGDPLYIVDVAFY